MTAYDRLLQLYFDRSNALQWYWTLYVVIIGGLLAFSSMRKERDRLTTLLVTILYCFFAYKNLGAIQDTLLQRTALLDAIQQITATATEPAVNQVSRLVEPTLIRQLPADVRNFHVVSDVLTLAAIWAMELRRKRLARAKEKAE